MDEGLTTGYEGPTVKVNAGCLAAHTGTAAPLRDRVRQNRRTCAVALRALGIPYSVCQGV